jgi:hypothetical protein
MASATDRLSLLAKIGELVVAIDATQVFQIHSAGELPVRQVDANLFEIELDRQTVPGWDLGALLQYGTSNKAWVVVDARLGTATRRFGLRVGPCIAVRKLPEVKQLPSKLFPTRPDAISGAFAAGSISELAGHPSGIVIDLAHVLSPAELEAGGRIARSHGADD